MTCLRAPVLLLLLALVGCDRQEPGIVSDRRPPPKATASLAVSSATTAARVLVITLDPSRLAAYGVTVKNVDDALKARRIKVLSERDVDHDGTSATEVRCDATDVDLEALAHLGIGMANGVAVRLSDVAMLQIAMRS